MNTKTNTKKLTLTALLTALAIVIPMIMPVKVVMPPFSATLASHTPLIISMFISPTAAIITSLGSAIGFLFSLGPVVSARAAMHVIFTLVGALMIRKRRNFFLTVVVTLILHTLSDMGIVWIIATLFGMGNILSQNTMGAAQTVIAIGTSAHHIIDYIIATAVVIPVSKAFPDMFSHTIKGKDMHI